MSKDNLNDGGPAFPIPGLSGLPNGDFLHPTSGMTMRQYYAAKAMQGELSAMCATDEDPSSGLSMSISDENLDRLAKHWFRIADAMIRAGGEA